MFYKKVIILKIYKFFVKWYYFFCNKNITYNSKECQTDLTNNKIENLLQLKKNITNIENNPEKYKWYL